MAFDQRFLDELIARSDIVDVVGSYVSLNKKGANYWGLCPFHNEKTPSFSVSAEKQICYCFGCKKGGGAINFIMEMENLSFPDAVRHLAKRANLPIPEETESDGGHLRTRVLSLNRDAAHFFHDTLHSPKGEAVRAYLNQRRISPKTATTLGLGASANEWDALITAMRQKGYGDGELLAAGLAVRGRNGGIYDKFRNRLMFPVIDVRGDVVAFGGRIISKDDPGAKYMNSPDTVVYSKRRNLYGLNFARKSKRSNILLVEGNIDVVTLFQAGFDNAVASMGTALTPEQIHMISNYTKELVLCYDNDGAGAAATQKALALLNNADLKVRVLELPKLLKNGEYVKQDADDFIKNQGPAAFENLLNGSQTGIDFRMAQVASQFDLTDDRGKVAYAAAAAQLIASLQSPVEREIYTARAAQAVSLNEEAMKSEVIRARKKWMAQKKKEQLRHDLNPAASVQPQERSLRYENVRSALAEEGVLRLLTLNDALFGKEISLCESDFSSPLLGKLFAHLWTQRQKYGKISVAALGDGFTPEEVNHLSGILQKPEDLKNAEKSLQDYISIIKQEAKTRSGTDYDPLLAAMEKHKRDLGGNKNG